MPELNEKEKAVFDFIVKYLKEHKYPPTVRDIGAAVGIKSTSSVYTILNALQEKGYIRKGDPNSRRALEVLVKIEDEREDVQAVERTDVTDVPIIGRVAAGTPITAEQNIEGSFPLPSQFVGKGEHFMLTVHGESMIEAGIMDGDYILVEQQSTARNGEIVVAQIEGFFESEATVKTFYKEGDHIRLQPENSSMSPIIVKDCKIIGKVKGVFRYMN